MDSTALLLFYQLHIFTQLTAYTTSNSLLFLSFQSTIYPPNKVYARPMYRVNTMESTATSSLIARPIGFRVIIVGGSIAGLTLAHCLSKLGVDYVILEKRQQIAPQEGASIGILPHGGRILDQLGLFNAIQRDVEPLTTAHISYPDGFTHTNQSPNVILERYVAVAACLFCVVNTTRKIWTAAGVFGAAEASSDPVRVSTGYFPRACWEDGRICRPYLGR